MAGVQGRSGGRNAKTAKQHRLEGTTQKHRHSGYTNADPPLGDPPKPKGLTKVASAEWDLMVEDLRQSKTLAVTDRSVLHQYCEQFAETEASVVRQARNEARADRLDLSIGSSKTHFLVRSGPSRA